MRDDRWIRDAGMIYTAGYTYAWAKSLSFLAAAVALVYVGAFLALLLGAIFLVVAVVWLVKNRRRVWRFTKKFFIGLFKLIYWTVKLPVLVVYWAIMAVFWAIALLFEAMLFVSGLITRGIIYMIAGVYYVYDRIRYARKPFLAP